MVVICPLPCPRTIRGRVYTVKGGTGQKGARALSAITQITLSPITSLRARESARVDDRPEKACVTRSVPVSGQPKSGEEGRKQGATRPGTAACASANCGLMAVGQQDWEELSAGLSV